MVAEPRDQDKQGRQRKEPRGWTTRLGPSLAVRVVEAWVLQIGTSPLPTLFCRLISLNH